jgi:hypothetical protein
MVMGPQMWEDHFGITSEAQFIEECSPWWPKSVGYIAHLDREQMLRLAYKGGVINPLSSIAFTGLMAEKKLGSLETQTRDALEGASIGVVEGWRTLAPLVIPGVARVAIIGAAGAQPVINVIGVRLPSGRTVQQAVNSVKAAWEATPSPLTQISQQYQVLRYEGTDLSSLDAPVAEATGSGGGRVAADASTAGACYLVKFSGGTRSRSANGRMYLGPMAETTINADGRTVAGGFRDGLIFDMTTFKDRLNTDGNPLCVISSKFAKAVDVTGVTVDPIIATQRRRIR